VTRGRCSRVFVGSVLAARTPLAHHCGFGVCFGFIFLRGIGQVTRVQSQYQQSTPAITEISSLDKLPARDPGSHRPSAHTGGVIESHALSAVTYTSLAQHTACAIIPDGKFLCIRPKPEEWQMGHFPINSGSVRERPSRDPLWLARPEGRCFSLARRG